MPLIDLWVFNIHMWTAPQQTSAAAQMFMDQQVSINKVVDVESQGAAAAAMMPWIYLGKLT